MRVFISHTSRDKALVRELVRYFPPWLATWIDEDELLFGAALRPSLETAINSEVDYVVLIFGRDAAESDWVKQEIAWAREREEQLARTFILPILVEDVRHHLADVGLDGRITLPLPDFADGSTRLLAERLVNHIAGWMSEALKRLALTNHEPGPVDSLAVLGRSAAAIIRDIPSSWRPEVESLLVGPFVDGVSSARVGAIPLTPGLYYQRVLAEMGRADDRTRILAVSTLSSELWSSDSDQTRYSECNLEAVHRGAQIRRLFVLPETGALTYEDGVRRQEDAGIEARVGSTNLLSHAPDLDDFVLFQDGDSARAYVAHPSIDGSRRIRGGALLLSTAGLARKRDAFELAWDLAVSGPAFFKLKRRAGDPGARAPGVHLASRYLDKPVISCDEAAHARSIPLSHELKTLVVRTDHGVVAAHIPGDSSLSLRKIKTRLETTQAHLADASDIADLGLSPGTVCAILEPVWAMPHLISRRVLTMNTVMTNNGTRTGYFEFEPRLLTEANNVIVGDFEQELSSPT